MTNAASIASKRPAKALEIMSTAQELIQNKGYNGFSFRDVADAVGIKSASIHYHFPTKSDLVKEIAANYRAAFQLALGEIDAQSPDWKNWSSMPGCSKRRLRKRSASAWPVFWRQKSGR